MDFDQPKILEKTPLDGFPSELSPLRKEHTLLQESAPKSQQMKRN